MKKILLFLFTFNYFFGQVGIGTIDPKAALHIGGTKGGLLLPQIALLSDTDLSGFSEWDIDGIPTNGITVLTDGTLIYNTTDNSSLDPGFYYWSNSASKWLSITYNDNAWQYEGNDFSNYFEDNDFVTGVSQTTNSSGNKPTLIDNNLGTSSTTDWTFNSDNSVVKRFMGTATGDDSPYFLANNGVPAFMVYDYQFLAMRRGTASNPAYTFYDAPGTGISASTTWLNDNTGKGRLLSDPKSTNLDFSSLDFSVDETKVLQLKSDSAIFDVPIEITGTIELNNDGTIKLENLSSNPGGLQAGDLFVKNNDLFFYDGTSVSKIN